MRSINGSSNIILATAVAFTAAFSPVSAIALDEHGCFDTINNCVSVSSRWSGDTLVASYTNNCGSRIFARYCSERPSGNHDCGAGGIRAGSTKTWSTYDNATGDTRIFWTGSVDSRNDWVCVNKLNGWNDNMF